MKRILLLSFRFPYPLTSGAAIRIYNIAKILAQKYQVDLLSINEGAVTDEHLLELEKLFNNVIVYPFRPLKFKLNALKGLFTGDSLQTYYYHFGKVQRWIDKHYSNYDLIFCFHIRMTRYLRKIVDRPKVIDFIDATSINYREARERVNGVWKLISSMQSRTAEP